MRVHKINNVNKALDFIASKGVKLVSIGAEGEWMGPGAEWCWGNSLEAQQLELCFLTAEDPGSIPGQGTTILQATQPGKKKNKLCWWSRWGCWIHQVVTTVTAFNAALGSQTTPSPGTLPTPASLPLENNLVQEQRIRFTQS